MPYNAATCDSNPCVFESIFTTRVVLSTQDLFAIEKVATAGVGNKKNATTFGLDAVDNEAVGAEAAIGG